ncbi:hypothetical protein E4K72_04450 [Oxalobacteraceae bacterium OM1]|nr:hypothetical protein E4K72_04450 [Oxalobacteraceae bacterium OM1]
MPLAEIETTYWDCEFKAGQALLGSADADSCIAAFEHLKTHKFDGDFQRFLVWWKDNKHQELSRRRDEVPGSIQR